MPSYPPAVTTATSAATCCARVVALRRTADMPWAAIPSVTVGMTATPAAWIRAVSAARVVASTWAVTVAAEVEVNQNGLLSVNRSRLATRSSVEAVEDQYGSQPVTMRLGGIVAADALGAGAPPTTAATTASMTTRRP